jgi:hypothetical protein
MAARDGCRAKTGLSEILKKRLQLKLSCTARVRVLFTEYWLVHLGVVFLSQSTKKTLCLACLAVGGKRGSRASCF